MGTTNFGNQILSFDYNQEATGKLFNIINYKLTPVGIYEGLRLQKISDSLVSITPGVCFIQDTIVGVGVRVETVENQSILISNASPYVVLRMEWVDVTNCYMDMLSVAFSDIRDSDVIVGRVIYNNTGLIMLEEYDYTRRNDFYNLKARQQNDYVRVQSTEPPTSRINTTAGVLNSPKGNLIVPGGTFPSAGISPTVNGRIDLVYIDVNGQILIQEGIDSATPVAPEYGNRKVIAEIRRSGTKSIILGSEIFSVISSFDIAPTTKDLLLTDAGNLYSSTNVEDALQEIAGNEFVFKGVKTIQGALLVEASASSKALTLKGTASTDIFEVQNSDGAVVHKIDQNGKVVNTVGSNIKISDSGNVFDVDEVDAALNQISNGTMTFKGTKTFAGTVNFGTVAFTNLSATTASITTLTANTVNTTSLRRKKKNIEAFKKSALDIIDQVDVVTYQYKKDLTKTKHIGFIADDTPEELSGKNKDCMMISDTIGVLLKAVQELNDKIKALENR